MVKQRFKAKFNLPRLLAYGTILGVGIFLAGCSPTFEPGATGPGTSETIQAGRQTAELVTWLNDATTGTPAQAAAPSQSHGDADAPAQLRLMTAREPEPVDTPRVSGHADGSCDEAPYTITLAGERAPASPVTPTVASEAEPDEAVADETVADEAVADEAPTREINILIDFLYSLPRNDGTHPSPYEGNL